VVNEIGPDPVILDVPPLPPLGAPVVPPDPTVTVKETPGDVG
jgi:hypothetical protein